MKNISARARTHLEGQGLAALPQAEGFVAQPLVVGHEAGHLREREREGGREREREREGERERERERERKSE